MQNTVATALQQLEAEDRTDSRPRRAAETSLTYVRQAVGALYSGAEKAADLAERGGVSYVETASALGRGVRRAAADDTMRAIDHVERLVQSTSAAEAVTAQAGYLREQTRIGVERWRRLAVLAARAAGAAVRTVEGDIHRSGR